MLPVEPATLGLFTLAALTIVLSPGPDTLIILRHSLTSGREVGLAAVAGVQVGLAVHTLLAVLGISLIVASSPLLFHAIGLAGAAYLCWLGWQGFRSEGLIVVTGDGRTVGAARALRQAMLTNLLNPKVILLFLALFPNFVDRSRDNVTAQLLTLAAVLVVINTLWQAPMALAAATLRRWLGRAEVRKRISQLTGVILFGFGLALLYEHLG
jgi:RhtB (resistance to homoserine/threonine) family protein